jgi:aminopeptidase-like protein
MSESVGHAMHRFMAELYPICRSITGNGVRETLRLVRTRIPIDIREVPSGTPVFDWTVPKEWNVRDGYVKNSEGERVIDFRKSNLHVLGYSTPIQGRLSLAELKTHLYSLPEHPDWIPYRTSYYTDNWGFCLTDRQLKGLPDGEYQVCIDSTLTPGSLTYGEYYLPGENPDEILLSCHICHPSLANDNLSGIALATQAATSILNWPKRRYSYRVLLAPATIGAITWLALNEATAGKIKHGLILSCLGDPGHCTYKKSRQGNAEVDRAAAQVLKQSGDKYEVVDFTPYGYDERQYCSPGFNLPVGCFMRTPNGRYPEYHSSADNLEFVRPECLADSLEKLMSILFVLEKNATLANRNPKCEPQLGKRGLYASTGGSSNRKALEMAMLWVLNLSDGKTSLLEIADRSALDFRLIRSAADLLEQQDLLEDVLQR